MTTLLEKKCIPCTGNLPQATEAEINSYKTQIPNWDIVTENGELHLKRVYKFPNFKTALAFTNLAVLKQF